MAVIQCRLQYQMEPKYITNVTFTLELTGVLKIEKEIPFVWDCISEGEWEGNDGIRSPCLLTELLVSMIPVSVIPNVVFE